ncbi:MULTISPECIES: winged helix DNA-binding domain-containing protein [unclassified Microbacterium]|uniref:winged helix DNA-binding domain-containing protein n=1 Tax=unclassified Microbacterium TaxID=2609290 RepID=UPI000EAAB075|nr:MULTISPECIES: winged helix DNA-binding domain-containing protein [unclassified Microbacterium]MBT2485211.1 AlkZ family DNA glycosylase [Microbacterium sp. ISL-108]RKN68037.1 winged helix DNA-binding domain-containing protein [Microbacterium sp. CGR2]
MKTATLLAERLRSHRLTAPAKTVEEAAGQLVAVQSQDFTAGRWALAVRTRGGPRLSDVDAAFDRGELVRAWTMRGTLHTVRARDLGWILEVTAGRQRQQAASRHRQLGIDDDVVAAAVAALTPALRQGGLTRAEIFEILAGIGIDPGGQRGIHLLFTLTIDGLICQGPVVARDGVTREQRFVLVAEHVREQEHPDDPLAELFLRYIVGHGPAGVTDFAWWSGLTLGQSREAAGRAAPRLLEIADGLFVAPERPRRAPGAASVHALGAFDEYYISYADRTTVCAPEYLSAVGPGKNGMVRATLVENGRVIGCWTHATASQGASPELFQPPADEAAVAAALARFARFIDG